jgi:hypothetical protein
MQLQAGKFRFQNILVFSLQPVELESKYMGKLDFSCSTATIEPQKSLLRICSAAHKFSLKFLKKFQSVF